MQPTNAELETLALLLALWGGLHSLLASDAVSARLMRAAGLSESGYRRLYVAVSIVTFTPVMLYEHALHTAPLLTVNAQVVPRLVLAAGAVVLLLGGALQYDPLAFVGLRASPPSASLRVGWAGRVVRHPWYCATLMLVWARAVDAATVVTAAVLSLYLILGTLHEERRLVREFGDAYRQYQRTSPMLAPTGPLGRALRRSVDGRRSAPDNEPRRDPTVQG